MKRCSEGVNIGVHLTPMFYSVVDIDVNKFGVIYRGKGNIRVVRSWHYEYMTSKLHENHLHILGPLCWALVNAVYCSVLISETIFDTPIQTDIQLETTTSWVSFTNMD